MVYLRCCVECRIANTWTMTNVSQIVTCDFTRGWRSKTGAQTCRWIRLDKTLGGCFNTYLNKTRVSFSANTLFISQKFMCFLYAFLSDEEKCLFISNWFGISSHGNNLPFVCNNVYVHCAWYYKITTTNHHPSLGRYQSLHDVKTIT